MLTLCSGIITYNKIWITNAYWMILSIVCACVWVCVSPGKRSAVGIVQWLKRRSGPGAQVLDSVAAAAQFIDSHNITVVGFFEVCFSIAHLFIFWTEPQNQPTQFTYFLHMQLWQNLESDEAKLLQEVYLDKADTEIAVTSTPEVFQKYEVKGNSVVLFKKVWTCWALKWEGRTFVWSYSGAVNYVSSTATKCLHVSNAFSSFIFCTHLLLSSGSWWSDGANPSCHRTKAGNTVDKLPAYRRATYSQTTMRTHIHSYR